MTSKMTMSGYGRLWTFLCLSLLVTFSLQSKAYGLTILVRSGWGTVNIGDIAHTPGLLSLLETYAPEAKVIVWGVNLRNGVEEVLKAQFPKVQFVSGKIGSDGAPDTPELSEAFRAADLLVHGSSPEIQAVRDLLAWRKLTGKPYGYYGVTLDNKTLFAQVIERAPLNAETSNLLNGASFIFFRDTASLRAAKEDGIHAPIMEFAPDAVFGVRQYDADRADAWMQANELEKGKFICVVVRTRFAPYWAINGRPPTGNEINRVAYNNQHKDADFAKIREAITQWVTKTKLKVALVPEMIYEPALYRAEIFEKLPEDVKPFIVCRDAYWMPDEAAALYAQAVAVMSMECHSPIIASAAGTPSLYLTSPTETFKKYMWRDIGLGDWMMEMDETDGATIAHSLLAIWSDPASARKTLHEAMDRVNRRQRETIEILKSSVK